MTRLAAGLVFKYNIPPNVNNCDVIIALAFIENFTHFSRLSIYLSVIMHALTPSIMCYRAPNVLPELN